MNTAASSDDRCELKNAGSQSLIPLDFDLRKDCIPRNAFGKHAPRNFLRHSNSAINPLRVLAQEAPAMGIF